MQPAASSLQVLESRLVGCGGLDELSSVETKHRLQEAIKRGFISLEGNSIELLPLPSLPEGLRHLGRDTIPGREAVRLHGVYGNPDYRAPTYLATSSWRGETNAWSDWDPTLRSEDKFILTVDSTALLKSRCVYIDPESLEYDPGPAGHGDKLGEMFLILGGIPRAAIVELYYPWGSGPVRRDAWSGLTVR